MLVVRSVQEAWEGEKFDRDIERKLQVERIMSILEVQFQAAAAGGPSAGYVRLEEQLAKLIGTNAPEEILLNIDAEIKKANLTFLGAASTEEFSELVEEGRKRLLEESE